MSYIKSLLYLRLVFILLMGALSVVTTGLAGRALRQLHNNTVFVREMGKMANVDAKLHAGDVVAALACTCTAAGVGFIVACYSEFQLHRERKNGTAPWGSRLINELLLVGAALFMLGSNIASTIIVLNREGRVSGVSEALQQVVMKTYNKSTKYRDYMCYPAMIVAWVTFATYVIVVVLVVLAGLYYRKQARQARYESREEKHHGHHVEA